MKQALLVICILISISTISQTKYAPVKQFKDSTGISNSAGTKDSITQKTVFFITLEDINRYMDKMKDKVSARQYDYITAGIQAIVAEMIQEKKNKPVKP